MLVIIVTSHQFGHKEEKGENLIANAISLIMPKKKKKTTKGIMVSLNRSIGGKSMKKTTILEKVILNMTLT